MSKSGKSAKSYRIERDAALLSIGLSDVQGLVNKLGRRINEDTLAQLREERELATNNVIFKATDALIKQNRLISAKLAEGKYVLEFKL